MKKSTYFYKPIFRCAIILMVLYFAVAVYENEGMDYHVSVSCENSSMFNCKNPFYECRENYLLAIRDFNCDSILSLNCEDFCYLQSIAPGQSYGKNPGLFFQYYKEAFAVIIGLAFVINHILYILRRRSV